MSESDRPIEENSYSGGAPLDPQQLEDDNEIPNHDVSSAGIALSRANINDEDEADTEDDDDEEEEEDFMALIPPAVRGRVEKMKELNSQRDAIMAEYLTERAALEQKYLKLCEPLYTDRAQIICGKQDKMIAAQPQDNDQRYEEGEEELVGVPEFWFCAMSNIEVISDLLTERDNECMLHLKNITCEDFSDGKGFELKFYFSSNPFFNNEVLSKRYEVPNLLIDDEPILKMVTGCDIDWKPSNCLTHKDVVRKQRRKTGKGAGQVRTVTKKERSDSFFHFFSPPKIPNVEDMNEEEADAIEEAFDHDYEIAQSFRNHIIPKAVLWFTGEALEEELQGFMEGGLSDEQEGDEESKPTTVSSETTEDPECKQS